MGDKKNNRTTVKRATCPEDVLRMIAWYQDEALGDDERARIEAHAAECAACRSELAWISGEAGANLEVPELALPSADAMYARIDERIAAEAAMAQSTPTKQPTAKQAPESRRADPRAPSTEWRRLALAASVILAVAGAFAAGRSLPGATEPIFDLATGPAAIATNSGPSLDVIFAGEATAERIHGALRAIGGRIVEGPSRLGVYRVQLQPGADAEGAARMLRADGEGVASLAEASGA